MVQSISSEQLRAGISDRGAELCSVKNNHGLEYLWQAGDTWPRHAPVLFPVVGKLKDDMYRHNGATYRMPQHGFARDMHFARLKKTVNSCLLELRSSEETLKIYPFEFALKIGYTIENNKLTCAYEVANTGTQMMYFSLGAHPGFRCPLETGESYTDYYIKLENRTFLQTSLEDGLRTNETKVLPLEEDKLLLSENIFDNDALVFENGQVHQLSLVAQKTGHRITMQCEGWPYFGIWSKKGNSEFICLEPWHGVADHKDSSGQLIEKQGIISLGPGSTAEFSYTITFT